MSENMPHDYSAAVVHDAVGATVWSPKAGVYEVVCHSHATQRLGTDRPRLQRMANHHNKNHHPNIAIDAACSEEFTVLYLDHTTGRAICDLAFDHEGQHSGPADRDDWRATWDA